MPKNGVIRGGLNKVPSLIKRFRQSILAAATSGALTEDWRNAGNQEQSNTWSSIQLANAADSFSYGTSSKSNSTGTIPVLRMGNIQNGKLDWDGLVFTSDPDEIKKYRLNFGDVLFNRTNSPELVGKTAVYRGERSAIYAGYLIRVKCSEKLLPDFLNYCLNSPYGRDYCWQVKSDGVSQSNINAKKLAALPIELPPVAEQQEIVRRVEALFAVAEKLEANLTIARTRVNQLTPSILAQAFRGELVPQDPKDEPASELISRIYTSIEASKKTGDQGQKTSYRSQKMSIKLTQEFMQEIIRSLPQDQFTFDELRQQVSGDYDTIKEIMFSLLNQKQPAIKQIFDVQAREMKFARLKL